MGVFAVDVEALRLSARAIDDVVREATVAGQVAHPSPVGDAGLAGATSAFATTMQEGWRERLAVTADLADGLREAAARYERSDRDGQDRVRSAARVF